MLSHPANPEPEEATVATATSLLREAAANRRRPSAVQSFLSQFSGEFFRNWFLTGPRLVLTGKFSRRHAAFMVAAALPGILTALFLTVPGLLFHTPKHFAYFHFANFLENDVTSMIPVVLGTVSSLFSFRFPLCS